MKTKENESTAKEKYGKAGASPIKDKKRAEDRDLNEDDQNRITNAPVDEHPAGDHVPMTPLEEIEQEEDRENKRKVEDARGQEEEQARK